MDPLLAELHAHSTWSDGTFSIPEVVDLYGTRGFDILCITDHVVRSDGQPTDPDGTTNMGVRPGSHAAYLAEIDREAARARSRYDLLLLPGLELTYNDADPDQAAHAVAVGLERHVSVDQGIGDAMAAARQAGAAIIAAHPFDDETSDTPGRLTRGFAADPALRELADRFELFNRTTLFSLVAREGLPAVASGDFHRLEHLAGWKTLLPCDKDAEAVVGYLRSPRPAYLTRLGAVQPLLAA